MKKISLALLLLLAAGLLSACGTVDISLEDQSDEGPTPVVPDSDDGAMTSEPQPSETVKPTLLPATPEDVATVEPVITSEPPTTGPQDETSGPADWLQYRNDEFGVELWHPPGTYIEEREPSSPEAWNEKLPDGLVEEQLYSAVVFQDLEGEGNPASRQAILEIKLVANRDGVPLSAMAELFSFRCPGPLAEPLGSTTMSIQLMGYRYTCEGMMPFVEFWAPYADQNDTLFGAAWAAMFSPLSEDILATVTFDH